MRLAMTTLLLLALVGAPATPRFADPPQRVTSEQLGGVERYLTHVSTDKPIYRPGETVFARGVVLAADTHRALTALPWLQVDILGPKGEIVDQAIASGADGVAAFTWAIPGGQPGGLYRLKVHGGGVVPGERSFEVRSFRAPRISTQIVFLRDGHGAGDEVVATVSATRAEGGAPVGAAVTLVVLVDGEEIERRAADKMDTDGRATVSFRLPASIERGEGTLALIIEDGGVVETATKTIPILLRAVDVALYPEGGDLVAGIAGRLYFEARTPAGKPADIAGDIETIDGRLVTHFRSEHEGRGRVRITPVAGESYRMRITEPAGVEKTIALPETRVSGGSIVSFDEVTAVGAPLRLRASVTKSGTHEVTVSLHEKEIAKLRVNLSGGDLQRLTMALPSDADGILRVTLWNDDGIPLAERLIFRRPTDDVRVTFTCDRERYVPAGMVALRVKTTHADGSPIATTVGLSVSDDSVRELLETRDQPPPLPAQVFLEDDVRELADATAYLDPVDPKAARAMDLLLGTQGWRRFAFMGDPQPFIDADGDAARRALALFEPDPQVAVSEERMDMQAMKEDDGIFGLEGGVIGGVIGLADGPAAAAAPLPMKMPMAADKRAAAEPAAAPPAIRVDQVMAKDEAKLQRQQGRARNEMVFVGEKARMAKMANVAPLREYAHVVRPGRMPGERSDFTDTVYWNAGLKTNEAGEASVTFALSDSVTSFRVLCDAFTQDGILGAGSRLIESVEPFYIEPKLPLEVTYGDVVRLPISAVNGSLERLTGVTLMASALPPLTVRTLPPFSLAPGDRVRSLLDIRVGQIAGVADLTLTGHAGSFSDSVTRSLRVVPLGFPVKEAFGGTLEPGARVSHVIDIPDDVVIASAHADIRVFPSSLGKLTSALERLIQEPHGCFEQTSSTTYPLVMAQQYFMSHQGVDPALVTRSQEMLGKGYDRLTGYETTTQGYEWFGEAPGHEALSAFGLMEFTDMSKVRSVDAGMLTRTRAWLLATRDGKGGFTRGRRALHTWIEDQDCSNAYITWSLLEAGESASTLTREIDALTRAARASSNGYVHALTANVLQLAGRSAEASTFLSMLASHQNTSGALDGATATIVGSSGESLQIEATALATLAFLRSPTHRANAEKAAHFLAESCEGGRYGSTQATVLALRAIVAHDAATNRPRAAGILTLFVDGKAVGTPLTFDEKSDGALTFPDIGSLLKAGAHRVELAMQDGSSMPYAIEVSLNRQTPESSPDCPLDLKVGLSGGRFVEGDIAEATLQLQSRADEMLPMTVAIVGLPGGFEPRHEQLKELVRAKTIAAYEVIGREVVLYFRGLDAHASLRVPLSLVAVVPGTYTGPASRAYLYYGDENKTWVAGLKVEIAPR